MLFSTERTGRVELYLGVQYLVAGRVFNNAPIFCDVKSALSNVIFRFGQIKMNSMIYADQSVW
jgi:hypothetical protein